MPSAVPVCILAFKVFETSPQINGEAGIWTQAYLTTKLLMLVPLCGGEWIPCHSTSNFPDKMPISRADISMWSSYQFLSLEKSMFYCCPGVNSTALESENKRDYNGNKSGCCLHRKWHLEAFPVRAPCWVHYNVNNRSKPTEMATCAGSRQLLLTASALFPLQERNKREQPSCYDAQLTFPISLLINSIQIL